MPGRAASPDRHRRAASPDLHGRAILPDMPSPERPGSGKRSRRELPGAEPSLLDGGHCLLETCLGEAIEGAPDGEGFPPGRTVLPLLLAP